MKRTLSRPCALALCLLLTAARSPAAPVTEEAPPPQPMPFGIADAEGKLGFVANAQGGIDVLDLETGKLLWDTKEANKPLALVGKRLVAQAAGDKGNSVRVVVFDVKENGKVLLRSDAVVFPDWVAVGLALGRSFQSRGWVEKGDLLLRWQARAWYAGGAAPTPEIEERARKSADGVARVGLDTGKVEMLAADKAPSPPAVKVPKEVEKLAARKFFNGVEQESRVLVAGKFAVAADVEPAGKKPKLVLKRWDLETAKALDPVTLLEGQSLRVEVAGDGRHVLVHQALTKQALPEGDYAWWVFALETGKQVAKFAYEEGTTVAAVVGPRAYYAVNVPVKGGRPDRFTQPRTLKAVDLKSGKVIWDRPVEPQRTLPLPP